MKYEPLSKLYYKDKNNYETVYKERIASGIKTGIEINDYPSFYVQEIEVYKKIVNIQRINDRIMESCKSLPPAALDRYADKCLIEEIVVTNEIEGVHSTKREIEDVLEDLGAKDKRKRFRGLVNKYRMLNRRASIRLETSKDVRALYDELVAVEVAEQDTENLPDGRLFRKRSVEVVSPAQESIHSGLMPENTIIETMDKALMFLNSGDEDIIIRTAVFHYLFGYIHPFYDGNGRLSRFISSYMLTKVLHPLIGYTLSFVIKENIRGYYKAFKECNDKHSRGDMTPFIVFFVDVVEKACLQLEEDLTQKVAELSYYRDRIDQVCDDDKMRTLYDILLQGTLFSITGIPTEGLLQILEISRPTLNKRLSIIRDRGLLEEERLEKRKYYRLRIDKLS